MIKMNGDDKKIWLSGNTNIVSGIDHKPLFYELKMSNQYFLNIKIYPSIQQVHIGFTRNELLIIKNLINKDLNMTDEELVEEYLKIVSAIRERGLINNISCSPDFCRHGY
jgi:hypothetical protein